MAARAKKAAHSFSEGGGIVRGVVDPIEAFGLLLEEDELAFGHIFVDAYQATTGDSWPRPGSPEVGELADDVWTWVKERAIVGRFRFVPCAPGHPDSWTWMIRRESKDAKGPGVFSGVEFLS